MATKAGTITAGRRPGAGLRDWAMLPIAALAVAALVMSAVALRSGAPPSAVEEARGAEEAAFSGAVYELSAPVTGTGPGLAQLARYQAYQRSAPVTGTGPGLVAITGHLVYQRSAPVTGTGPGLTRIEDGA